MTPDQDEVIDRMKSLIEAVGIVRSSLLDRIEAVAYHYDPAALQGELREVRAALNEIRSAVLTMSMDLMEGEDDPCGCMRAEATAPVEHEHDWDEFRRVNAGGGVDAWRMCSRCGKSEPVTCADDTAQLRTDIEHGDEVAF